MQSDTLELTLVGGANVQTVNVKRGSFSIAPGHLSYVGYGDETEARTCIALHRLDRWRFFDNSRATA